MYRYRKRLWSCEKCGKKVEILALSNDGKHVCRECDDQYIKVK